MISGEVLNWELINWEQILTTGFSYFLGVPFESSSLPLACSVLSWWCSIQHCHSSGQLGQSQAPRKHQNNQRLSWATFTLCLWLCQKAFQQEIKKSKPYFPFYVTRTKTQRCFAAENSNIAAEDPAVFHKYLKYLQWEPMWNSICAIICTNTWNDTSRLTGDSLPLLHKLPQSGLLW